MPNSTHFRTLNLSPELLNNLGDLGYHDMTLVQAQALPLVLDGKDVMAQAKTGSGKTAAFGLGLLNKLDVGQFRAQALVLCPTRELADQVAKEIRRLARAVHNVKVLSLCGGAPIGPQIASLERSAHVIVGTPGRVLKHLRKATLKLGGAKTLVLDEADRMLDMGFEEDLDAIVNFLPKRRQTLLFSATYPKSMMAISRRVQREPVVVDVTEDEKPAQIEQRYATVTVENRQPLLVDALKAWGGALNVVFCNTRVDCAEVGRYLKSKNITAVALHGDLDQSERTQVLVRFANRSASVLIATDVAARGLDVKDLDVVFNYELPKQAEVYVHRIGRTARAGKTGLAVSLVEAREHWRWDEINELVAGKPAKKYSVPGDLPMPDFLVPEMSTVQINGGRKNKLRPGDLLGTLTADGGVPGSSVGKIDLFDTTSFVAVRNADADKAVAQLNAKPIKTKRYRARVVR
ncbi:MAG: ATP-dependent RNA helicase DbpA [Lysobacterales bacterium]